MLLITGKKGKCRIGSNEVSSESEIVYGSRCLVRVAGNAPHPSNNGANNDQRGRVGHAVRAAAAHSRKELLLESELPHVVPAY